MSNFWTREAVWARYVEAFDTLRRLPGGRRSTTAWPAIIRDFADALCAEEQRAAELYPFPKGWDKPGPPTHQAIDRMEQLWTWHARYLASDETAARLMIACAYQRATGKPLQIVFRARRVARRTGYAILERAKNQVRDALNSQNIEAENNPLVAA